MKSKKVCHISSVHSALDVRIFYRECKSLVSRGYKVTLIARHTKNELIDGINIVSFPSTNSRLYRFLILSFYLFYKALKQKADIYHFHDPELMFIGLLLKLFGKKVIYDVHEDLPKQIYNKPYIKDFIKPLLSWFIKKIESFFSKRFDGIVTVVPTIYKRFLNNNLNTIMFRNFPDLEQVDKSTAISKNDDKFIIIYPGSLSRIRGIEDLINVVSEFNGGVELWLLGNWSTENFKKRCQNLKGWNYTRYIGRKSLDDVYKYIKASDLGAHIIHDKPSHKIGYPVKAFDFMACNKTFLISDIGNKKKLFEECAYFVEAENLNDIKNQIKIAMNNKELSNSLAKKGRKIIETKFNLGIEVDILHNFYKKILKENYENI